MGKGDNLFHKVWWGPIFQRISPEDEFGKVAGEGGVGGVHVTRLKTKTVLFTKDAFRK